MRRAPLAAAAFFAASAAFAADTAATPLKASFIGEGGGYKAPDKTTEGVLVGEQPPPPAAALPAPAPEAPAPAAPTRGPVSRPEAARPAPAAPPSAFRPAPPRPAAPVVDAKPAAPVSDAKPAAQSLWNGLVQPLSLTASEAAESSDPDAARAAAGRDYETHILGMRAAPARDALASRPASAAAASNASAASARAAGGKVFVSLALDPREAGSLRDAVAGLGASAGFSADARFEAMPGPNGTVLYSGWIPSGRLADALKRPGVKSVRVETRAAPSSARETSGEFLVGLRLEDPARAREGVDAGVAALAAAANFRLTRIVGLETAPDGRAVAVVAGVLPLSKLSRAMGLSEVAKIVPLGGVPAPAAPVVPAGPGGIAGFAKFAVERGPWLIILTLLLLLPSLRAPARRALSVFSPYR